MQKNSMITLTCGGIGQDMEGVCRSDGMAVFVKGMLPGETGRIVITKVHRSFAFGRLQSLETRSVHRQEPPCPYAGRCGGCACQHMTYAFGLEAKRQNVADCFMRIGGIHLPLPDIAGMEQPFHYRNKTALPVGGTVGNIRMGFFAPRSHDIIPVDRCLISMEPANHLQTALMQWMVSANIPPYDEKTHTGLIRHLVTRVNRRNEAMATLVVNGPSLPDADGLVQTFIQACPGFRSAYLNINESRTNVIFGDVFRPLYGKDAIEERLCGLVFRISPSSFFQVNTSQAEVLYRTVLAFARPGESDTAADIYCGAGAITLLMAQNLSSVLGIEENAQAVLDARANALANGIANASFYQGTAEYLLPRMAAEGYHPDIVTLDPPRKGLSPAVIDAVALAAPSRVVYVACDAATQARDAKLFAARGYRVTRSMCVDMFCWTGGIEHVILLEPA